MNLQAHGRRAPRRRRLTLQEQFDRVSNQLDVVGHRLYSRDNWNTATAVKEHERVEALRKKRNELKLQLASKT